MPNSTALRSAVHRWAGPVALVAVALAALYQCLWNPGGTNTTGDEQIYVSAGWQYVHGDFAANREHPPTGKYLFGLAQLLSGQGVLGPRVLVGLLVLGVGVVLYCWLRREIGHWGALAAAAIWLLTPRGGAGIRVDRLALLDPVMTAFAVFAVAAAWAWMRRGHLWLAALSGVLMAVSVTSKVTTVVLLPAFLLLPVLFRAWRPLVVGGAVWVASFGVAFVALYVPAGIRSGITYMLTFQEQMNQNGHPVPIEGIVYQFPPWWASLYYMVTGVGVFTTVVLVVGLVAALVLRPDRLVAYVTACLGLVVLFYLAVAKVALPTYYTAWMPFLVVLAAIGYARIAALRPRVVTSAVATVVVLSLVVPSTALAVRIARAHPTGIAVVAELLRSRGREDGGVLFEAMSPSIYTPYFDGRATFSSGPGPFVAIVEGTDPRFPAPEAVTDFLTENRQRFDRTRIDGITVWIPRDGSVTIGASGPALVG